MKRPLPFCLLLLMLPLSSLLGQHVHIYAGIGSSGHQLRFVNGANFDTNSLYTGYGALGGAGAPADLYQVAGFTFAALAISPLKGGGPNNGHADAGAHLELQVVSVSGPTGGVFSLWQEDFEDTIFQFSEPVGQTNGTNRFALSENDGEPGADPYGHIHGRIFTMDRSGLYTVGFRIIDTSSNGPGGGPLDQPSDISYFYFQAGPTIARVTRDDTSTSIVVGTKLGLLYFLESTPALGGTNVWTEIGEPLAGNSHLQTIITDTDAPQQFFRLRTEVQ